MGVGIRREEWVVFQTSPDGFCIVLAVLAFTVARSTYRVNDAIVVDLNTKFTHEPAWTRGERLR